MNKIPNRDRVRMGCASCCGLVAASLVAAAWGGRARGSSEGDSTRTERCFFPLGKGGCCDQKEGGGILLACLHAWAFVFSVVMILIAIFH